MKKLLLLPLIIFCMAGYSQTARIVGDSTKLYQIGSGNNELILENSTRSLTGAFLKNKLNGRTWFGYALDSVWADGSFLKFRYGPNTLSFNISAYNVDSIGRRAGVDSFDVYKSGIYAYSIKDSTGEVIQSANGLYEQNDTIKLGGELVDGITHTYIPVDRKTSANVLRKTKVYAFSNRTILEDSTLGTDGDISNWWYWYNYGANALVWYYRSFDEAAGDTANQQYNAVIQSLNKHTLDYSSSRFDSATGKPVTLQYGGAYMHNQFAPVKNTVVSLSPYGQSGASYHGTFAVSGRDSVYNLTLNPGIVNPIPLSIYEAEFDFDRSNGNKSRTIKGGMGVAGYTAHWRSKQGGGLTGTGANIHRVTDFFSLGSLATNPEGTGVTKVDMLAESKIDSAYGFYSHTKRNDYNEVNNGYGFVQAGVQDVNHFQGYSRFGGLIPGYDSIQGLNLEVIGKSNFRDTATAITVGTSDSSNILATTKWVKQHNPINTGSQGITKIGNDFQWNGSVTSNRVIDFNYNKKRFTVRPTFNTDSADFNFTAIDTIPNQYVWNSSNGTVLQAIKTYQIPNYANTTYGGGTYLGAQYQIKDSATITGSNGVHGYGNRSEIRLTKMSGYSGRSVYNSGNGTLGDAIPVQVNNLNFSGSTTVANHRYVRGYIVGNTSYLSLAGANDTIQNWVGFHNKGFQSGYAATTMDYAGGYFGDLSASISPNPWFLFGYSPRSKSYIAGPTGFGDSTIDASALIDASSTTKGILPPRMTSVQKTAIPSPGNSLFLWDTDSLRYMGYNGTAWKGVAWTGESGSTPTLTKNAMVENPIASENLFVFRTPIAITVTDVTAVLVGSSTPSVTYNIVFGTDRTSGTNVYTAGQTVTSTTTGTAASGVNDNTIPANSWIWITTSAQSGTVTQLNISLTYTED